jgi:hypothetical protein
MSQAYHKPPSDLYGVQGAAAILFDESVFLFGRWVESEVQEAERSASNEMFANMYRARTFARCMGDDMSESTVGFADPFADGAVTTIDAQGNRKRRSKTSDTGGDEVLWDESASA